MFLAATWQKHAFGTVKSFDVNMDCSIPTIHSSFDGRHILWIIH